MLQIFLYLFEPDYMSLSRQYIFQKKEQKIFVSNPFHSLRQNPIPCLLPIPLILLLLYFPYATTVINAVSFKGMGSKHPGSCVRHQSRENILSEPGNS